MAYDDIDFGSIIGDRANLYETADGKRFMATDAESPEAFNRLGLTRQKKVVFKGGDGYNHAVSVDDGFTPDDNWMREHDAKSIVKTETPDNYVYRVNTYALPDGQMTTVREDQDEEFRDWATKTYGSQPTLQTHARVNGVYVSGATDQINEVLRMAKEQETGLTAEQLAAIGVTEEQANAGLDAMEQSRLLIDDRIKKMGEMGYKEAESHDLGYEALGNDIDGGWDAVKAGFWYLLPDQLLEGTYRTPDEMIEFYGNPEHGLENWKNRSTIMKWADLARLAVGDETFADLVDMDDEEAFRFFNQKLKERKLYEYVASRRGRTTMASTWQGVRQTAGAGIDYIPSRLAESIPIVGPAAGVGVHVLRHGLDEYVRAKTGQAQINPYTGKLEQVTPGASTGRALFTAVAKPASEYVIERIGGHLLKAATRPAAGLLSKAIGRDRAILFGIMPGVASRPANTVLEKLAEKTAVGFRRFAAGNTWGAKLANLTGNAASRMTPSAIGGELFEEYLQGAVEGGLNLNNEYVDEEGQLITGVDLGNAAASFMDVFRTTPELALSIALYGAGSGVAARGYGALVDGYATKATMKKWLEKWGYDKAAIRSMSSEEMKTHFMDAITKPGEDAGKRAEEFLKDKSGKVLERLARSAFATSTNGYDIVETTDENGKKSFALVRNTWMAKLKPGETHNEAESRTQPVVLKSNSREEVESKLRELLVENAKQNGLYTLTVNPAMDDVTRAAMHITRGRQSEIRRVVQEMGMDKAFAGWGNSADVYDLLTQAITLRMAATSTNVRGTDYARFLRFAANHLENMAAAQMGAEYGKRLGANVFLQYSRYARGASVVTHPTKGEAPQVFKNPDEEKNAAEGVKWSVDSDGTEYMQEGDVRLERSLGKDHKYTYRVRMTGKYSSAPYYYSEAGKAFARANAMHESARSFEQEYEERKRRANKMYDELFGTDDDSRSGFTVVETVWEDPQAAAEIIEDLTAKGMTPEQAMAAMNKKAGVRLKSGRIVVFLNNINSLAELAATIRHEALHGGLEAHISEALGGDKAKALKFLKDVSAILREAGVPIKGLDGAALSEEDLDKLTDAEFRLAIDEALAALAETVSAKSGYSGRIFKIVNEAFHDKQSLDGLSASEKLDEARNILFDAYMRVNARDIGEDMDMAHAEEVVRSFQEKAFDLNKWKTPSESTGDETGPYAGMENRPRPDVPPGPKPKWGDAYDVFYGPDSGTAETEQVPVASISVNDRIKQFKRDADPETGIVEGDKLSGQWSDEFGQPIRLMRFKDGHLEVITGRHRLELAKRNGMDTIPARIYNESDGMTVDLAKAIDAIENIQAGKGSETDFITFFIKSHLDRRIIDALQLNTSENTQIKAAWDIATKGVNGLISYALIPREGRKVGILALGAIAEQPANIQMQLLAEAHNDTTGAYRDPVFIRQFGQRIANAEHYEDVELFGEDDPAIVQMKLEAIGIKTIIKRLEGDLQTINNAINSRLHNAIRPELVKRYGIKDQRDKKELRQVADKIRKQIEAYESPSVSGALLEEARKVGKEELEKINKRNKARGVQDIMSFINDFSERPLGKNEDPNTRGYTQPEPTPEPEPTPTGGTGTGGPTPTGEPDKGTEAPPGTTGPQPTDGHSAEEPLPDGVDHVRDGDGYIQWATREHNAYKLRFKFGEGPGSRKETKGKTVKGVYVYDTNVDGSIRPETEEFYELLDKPYTSKGGKVHYGHMTNRNHQGEGMRSAFGNMWNVLDAWAVAGYPGATESEKQGTHLVRLGLVQKPDTATDTTQEGDGFTLSGEPDSGTDATSQQGDQQEPEDPFSKPPDYTGSGMAQDDLFGNTEGQEQQPAPEPEPAPAAPAAQKPGPEAKKPLDPSGLDENNKPVTKPPVDTLRFNGQAKAAGYGIDVFGEVPRANVTAEEWSVSERDGKKYLTRSQTAKDVKLYYTSYEWNPETNTWHRAQRVVDYGDNRTIVRYSTGKNPKVRAVWNVKLDDDGKYTVHHGTRIKFDDNGRISAREELNPDGSVKAAAPTVTPATPPQKTPEPAPSPGPATEPGPTTQVDAQTSDEAKKQYVRAIRTIRKAINDRDNLKAIHERIREFSNKWRGFVDKLFALSEAYKKTGNETNDRYGSNITAEERWDGSSIYQSYYAENAYEHAIAFMLNTFGKDAYGRRRSDDEILEDALRAVDEFPIMPITKNPENPGEVDLRHGGAMLDIRSDADKFIASTSPYEDRWGQWAVPHSLFMDESGNVVASNSETAKRNMKDYLRFAWALRKFKEEKHNFYSSVPHSETRIPSTFPSFTDYKILYTVTNLDERKNIETLISKRNPWVMALLDKYGVAPVMEDRAWARVLDLATQEDIDALEAAIDSAVAQTQTPVQQSGTVAQANERGFDSATYDWSKGERNGRDVTKDDFKKTFGFNKVTIGKKGAQGQKIANAAYDAFVAFAKAVNIPYEAISLGGQIKGIELGIRNADRKGSFNGSFIKITKGTEGDAVRDDIAFMRGSTAIHEWAHALDAALSKGRNVFHGESVYAQDFMSNREDILPFRDKYTKPRLVTNRARADMVKAYDKMLDALHESGFWHRVYEVKRNENYPRRPVEMFARAMQGYFAALHSPDYIGKAYGDMVGKSDALDTLLGNDKGPRKSIYPYKDEVEELAPAFDAFFQALRVGTNEATGKMTLYRESEEAFSEAPRSTLKDRVEIRGAMAVPFAGSKASIVEDYPELFRGIGNAAKEAGGRIIDAFAGAGAYTAGLGALNALPQGSVLNEWAVSRYVMHKMLAENPEAMARAAEDIATRFVNSPEMAEVRRRVEQANKDGRHVVNLTQPVIDWFYDELNGKHGTIYVDGTDNTEFGDAALRETPESAALYQVLQSIVSSGYPVNFVWKKGELKIDVSGGNFRAGQVGRIAEKNGKTNKWRMSKPGEGVFNVQRYPQRILNTGRIYQQNGVQVTRGDGWALAKTARRGDVVLVDPAYLGTQSYGGKKNVDANDANNKDIAIAKLVDLVKWADANGVSVVYTNEFSDKSGMGGMSRADYEAVWREALDKIGSDGVAVNVFDRKAHGMRGSQAPRADIVFATGRVARLFNVSNAELDAIKARHGFETDEEAEARALDERTAVLDNITDSQESDDWRQTLYRESEDADYLDAVRRGDMGAAQRMVEGRAQEAGYTVPAFHGTDRFGFTVFDPMRTRGGGTRPASRRTVFFGEQRLAESYSGERGAREIGKPIPKIGIERIRDDASLYEEVKRVADAVGAKVSVRLYGGDVVDAPEDGAPFDTIIISLDANGVQDEYELFSISHVMSTMGKAWSVRDAAESLADEVFWWLDGLKDRNGNYRVALKMENPLTVDAKGESWLRVPLPDGGMGDTHDLAAWALEHGYDGVVIKNVIDNGGMTNKDFDVPMTEHIVFDPEQIKSLDAVTYDDNGNVIPLSQRFNPMNPDIRYRGATDDGAVEQVAAADAADFLRREARRMHNTLRGALSQGSRDRMAQWLEEAFINAQAPVFRLYRRIVDDLPPPRNAQEARLRDELNIEAAIKNEPGRIRWRREKLKRDYLDRINRILKQGKCDANLFSDYLYFHYVPERNAMLYARETTTDESGDVVLPFDPVTGEEIPFDQYKGSGYSNEEAKAGIERIERMPNGQAYKDAAKLVWEMNQNTLRELVQAGIIAQRQGERWMRDAPHYVPLKDIDAMDRKSALFSLRVVGRKIGHVATANTWAASAYQALEAQSMIERNNTKVKFLRFLKTYDPDGKHIKWWHLTNPGNEKEAGMEDAVYVSKYDEEYQKLKAAGVNMVEAGDGQGFFVASGGPSDYSKGKLGVHIRNKTKQGSNAVLVMQNGRRTYITFDASVYAKQRKEGTYVQPGRIEKYQRIGDADWEGLRIAEAMNDANKRRFDIPILSWATRFKARISTSWNPNFIIGNIPIDIINTVTIMGIEGRWKEARQFLRNYKSAMKTVYQYQRDRSYTDKQMGKYLEEAMQGGMMTGTYGQSFAAVDEDFRNTISGLEGGAGRIRGGVQGLVDKLDKLSNVAEIGTRLAVYAAMRMNGMNKNEAAQYGREITVDFNANGNYTPVINTLYMFSNAAAQSFVRYVNAVKYGTKLRGGGAKGLAKTLLPVIALHMALGFLIAMLNDADEDEGPGGEDESTERRIPDYVWEGGVPISLPFFDGYLNVPMRGALVPFMKAGRDTYEMFKGRKEATEVMGNLISGTLESTVNIFGQSPNLEQWISPTALDPFVQIMTGKDWTGRELYRRDYGQAGSDAHLGLGRTPSLYHWMAKGMNAATGGNDVEGGILDWRPETYKLLTDFFLGSLSGYALNSVDMVHGIGKGELPRPNDIPFVGRVLRETPGVSNRYYTALGESAELEKIYRKRVADSKSPELSAEKRRESAQQARDLREEHRWLKSVKAMGDLQRRITERRDRSKEMEDGPRKEAYDKETERMMGTWLRVYERR